MAERPLEDSHFVNDCGPHVSSPFEGAPITGPRALRLTPIRPGVWPFIAKGMIERIASQCRRVTARNCHPSEISVKVKGSHQEHLAGPDMIVLDLKEHRGRDNRPYRREIGRRRFEARARVVKLRRAHSA
jgi:hypothetical protein